MVRESGMKAPTLQAFDMMYLILRNELPIGLDLQWLERVVQLLSAGAAQTCGKVAAWFGPEDPMAEQLEDGLAYPRPWPCYLTDDRLKAALIRAHKRAYASILTDNDKSRHTDVRSLAAGLSVRMDRSRHHFHHKFALSTAGVANGPYNGGRPKQPKNFMRTGTLGQAKCL